MRKTAVIRITAEGRDKGKMFLLEEMPAARAEKWALKAFLALNRAGYEIPDDLVEAGIGGLATLGVKALQGMSFDDVEPLIDEIMGCVRVMPDSSNPNILRPLIENDIEEVATGLKLKSEVVKLHVSFSPPADRSKPESASAGTGWQSA